MRSKQANESSETYPVLRQVHVVNQHAFTYRTAVSRDERAAEIAGC